MDSIKSDTLLPSIDLMLSYLWQFFVSAAAVLKPRQLRSFCDRDYQIKQQIGAGLFGQVFRAKASDGSFIAIKQMKLIENDAEVEIKALTLLQGDPSLVQLICAIKEYHYAIIVVKNGRRFIFTGMREKNVLILHGDLRSDSKPEI